MTRARSKQPAHAPQQATVEVMNAHNAAVPFNAWLGAEVLSANDDGVHLRVPWRVEFGGAPGMTHGGILASIIDLSAYMALMAAKGSSGPTIDMRVDYHRSSVNGALYAHSTVLRVGSTISSVDVILRDAKQRLIASGRCVFLSLGRKYAPDALSPEN